MYPSPTSIQKPYPSLDPKTKNGLTNLPLPPKTSPTPENNVYKGVLRTLLRIDVGGREGTMYRPPLSHQKIARIRIASHGAYQHLNVFLGCSFMLELDKKKQFLKSTCTLRTLFEFSNNKPIIFFLFAPF